MTFSDLAGHGRCCKLFQVQFLYSCATVAKISTSTNLERRAVPLQQPSFLFNTLRLLSHEESTMIYVKRSHIRKTGRGGYCILSIIFVEFVSNRTI